MAREDLKLLLVALDTLYIYIHCIYIHTIL